MNEYSKRFAKILEQDEELTDELTDGEALDSELQDVTADELGADAIKEVLYKEIELLSLTKKAGDDKEERLIDSKTRKILQQQADNILSVLAMSVNKGDTRHYILGLLLRLLLEE